MKLATVQIAVHIRVGEKDFGRAAFDDYIEDVRALEFIEDCVERIMAALCFRHVLRASTTYR